MKQRYEVQTKFTYGWENVWRDENGNLEYFKSKKTAMKELKENVDYWNNDPNTTFKYYYNQYRVRKINYEKEKFTDHYKANGDVKADWDACFRNWIRRSIQFANARGQTKTFNSPYDSKSIQERRKRIYDVASVGDQTSNEKIRKISEE